MSDLILNPGAGDVPGATYANAARNVNVFMDDLRRAHGYVLITVVPSDRPAVMSDTGRWAFVVTCDGTDFEIDMPGLPTEQVRYTGLPQNPFEFPRLYVDGSSWLWKFGVNVCTPGEPEDDSGVKAGLTP